VVSGGANGPAPAIPGYISWDGRINDFSDQGNRIEIRVQALLSDTAIPYRALFLGMLELMSAASASTDADPDKRTARLTGGGLPDQ
jgi:hypothetical protein